jgi:hypothetical protein
MIADAVKIFHLASFGVIMQIVLSDVNNSTGSSETPNGLMRNGNYRFGFSSLLAYTNLVKLILY